VVRFASRGETNALAVIFALARRLQALTNAASIADLFCSMSSKRVERVENRVAGRERERLGSGASLVESTHCPQRLLTGSITLVAIREAPSEPPRATGTRVRDRRRALKSVAALAALLVSSAAAAQDPAVRLVVTNDVCLVGICPTTHPPAPTTVISGEPFSIYVTAFNSFNGRVDTLTSAVYFSTTDPLATLPANFAFVLPDHAVRTFDNGAVLRTPGTQTITVTDPAGLLLPGSLTLTVIGTVSPAVPTMSTGVKALFAVLLTLIGFCFARLRS
jgi:hypothetical protein